MVLQSDQPDFHLPEENLWNFLYPYFIKNAKLTAFIDGNNGETITFEEQMKQSLRWAKELKKHFVASKVPPTVLILLPNCLEYLSLILGSFAVGAIVCPTIIEATDDILTNMLGEIKPDVMVIDISIEKKIDDILRKLTLQPKIYTKGSSDDITQILQFGDALREEDAGQYDPSSIAVIVFSSGTTGAPKAIVLTSQNFLNGTKNYYKSKDFFLNDLAHSSNQQMIASNLPMAHSFGIINYCIINVVYGSKILHFNYKTVDDVFFYVNKYQPQSLYLRPAVMEAVSRVDDLSMIKSLKNITVTGAPVDPAATKTIIKKTENRLNIQECYGLTELFAIGITPLGNHVGGRGVKLLPNKKIKFINVSSGEEITKPHVNGEILVTGPGIMSYYLNNPEATKETIDSENWFHTGDIGYFDEENFIQIVDRKKDVITVGSTKFLPSELENLIKQHPLVKDAAVIGTLMSDVQEGSKVVAFVVPNDPESLNMEENIIKFVELNAPIKEMELTGGVKIMTDLPRNQLGKLLRKLLKEVIWYNWRT